jgi:hypothetical protein
MTLNFCLCEAGVLPAVAIFLKKEMNPSNNSQWVNISLSRGIASRRLAMTSGGHAALDNTGGMKL